MRVRVRANRRVAGGKELKGRKDKNEKRKTKGMNDKNET